MTSKKIPQVRSVFSPDSRGLLAEIAELYYKDGLTQNEIALRIGVSRPTIVNYIKQARELGIVNIQISGSAYSGSSLSRELCTKYGLEDVYIARTSLDHEQTTAARTVSRLGAMALSDLLQPGDVVGVSWGETIQRAADEMPVRPVKNLSVCQVIGSMPSEAFHTPEACTIRIANRTGGVCTTLHTPAILSTVELANQLRNEPIVKRQLAKFKKLTKMFFSVGDSTKSTLVVACGMASTREWKEFREQGATAVLCGHFLDAQGVPLGGDYSERIIGIQPKELLNVPMRMLVAGGADKKDAVKAALAGGYATHLVTDDILAEQL